jgi:hypothetical protein
LQQGGDVESLGIEDSAGNVGDSNDFVAFLVHEACSLRADVTKSLNNDACLLPFPRKVFQRLVHRDHAAAARGFAPAL